MFGSGTAIKYGGVKHPIVETIIIIVYSSIRASTQPYFMAVPEPKHTMVESTKLFSGCSESLSCAGPEVGHGAWCLVGVVDGRRCLEWMAVSPRHIR